MTIKFDLNRLERTGESSSLKTKSEEAKKECNDLINARADLSSPTVSSVGKKIIFSPDPDAKTASDFRKRKYEEEDKNDRVKKKQRDEQDDRMSRSSSNHLNRSEPSRSDRFYEERPPFRFNTPFRNEPGERPVRYENSFSNRDRIADFTFTMMNPKHTPYMDYIRQGVKKAEGRINSQGFTHLEVGKTIYFHNRHEGIICEITFLHKYPSFEKMLEAEGIDNMLPQLKHLSVDPAQKMREALKVYHGFPGSDRVKQWGALAIGVKFLKNHIPGR